MEIFKVELKTTNGLKDTVSDKNHKNYIDVNNGFIYVTKRDLEYIMENYEWFSIEFAGHIYERPTEMKLEEKK